MSGERSNFTARVWLIFTLGVAMTGFGVSYAAATGASGKGPSLLNIVIAGVLTAVGGGIVGAIISIVIATASDRDTVETVQEILRTSLESRFLSDEDRLLPMRRLWHHYFLTTTGGVSAWYYEVLDFRQATATASLTTTLAVEDPAGSKIEYKFEVGARGDHLYILSMVEGTRQTAVSEVFPRVLDFSASHFGIMLAHDWDGRSALSRTIISLTPLIQAEPGVVPESAAVTLDESWDAGFKKHHAMFPQVS